MKKFILSLIVLIGIISSSSVYALEDSFYEGEYIPGEYIIKIRGSSNKYKQMKVFRRKSDRPRYGFCVLVSVETTNSRLNFKIAKRSTKTDRNGIVIAGVSNGQIIGLTEIPRTC